MRKSAETKCIPQLNAIFPSCLMGWREKIVHSEFHFSHLFPALDHCVMREKTLLLRIRATSEDSVENINTLPT